MIYAANEVGVAALRKLAAEILESADTVISSAEAAANVLDDNINGLGPHAASIQEILESIKHEEIYLKAAVEMLSEKLEDLADAYQDVIDNDPYAHTNPDTASAVSSAPSGGGVSPGGQTFSGYTRRTEDLEITFTNPETGKRETVKTHRTVYENSKIDPNLEIPAGTKFMNGREVKEKTTNIERMRNGKPPFIAAKDKHGKVGLFPVECHHTDGRETLYGSEYFTGEKRDGGIIEIASTTHDIHDGILHIPGHGSFRVNNDGKRTRDDAKYKKYREAHWKERARRFDAGE